MSAAHIFDLCDLMLAQVATGRAVSGTISANRDVRHCDLATWKVT
jgi:hypothetical protein